MTGIKRNIGIIGDGPTDRKIFFLAKSWNVF